MFPTIPDNRDDRQCTESKTGTLREKLQTRDVAIQKNLTVARKKNISSGSGIKEGCVRVRYISREATPSLKQGHQALQQYRSVVTTKQSRSTKAPPLLKSVYRFGRSEKSMWSGDHEKPMSTRCSCHEWCVRRSLRRIVPGTPLTSHTYTYAEHLNASRTQPNHNVLDDAVNSAEVGCVRVWVVITNSTPRWSAGKYTSSISFTLARYISLANMGNFPRGPLPWRNGMAEPARVQLKAGSTPYVHTCGSGMIH